jgi:hypothetical protein
MDCQRAQRPSVGSSLALPRPWSSWPSFWPSLGSSLGSALAFPLALLSLASPPGLPSGSSLGSLTIHQTTLSYSLAFPRLFPGLPGPPGLPSGSSLSSLSFLWLFPYITAWPLPSSSALLMHLSNAFSMIPISDPWPLFVKYLVRYSTTPYFDVTA